MTAIKYCLVFMSLSLVIGCSNQKQNDKDNNRSTIDSSTKLNKKEIINELISTSDEKKVNSINGKAIFASSCALCHGMKGDMSINGSKLLNKSTSSLEERVEQIYFGKGTMTPFKGVLKNDEIIAVAKYLEKLR